MNIQEYISSGIVESYVLGLADPGEREEFERLCREHPELLAARDQFERSLETNAFAHQVHPPAFLKEKIFAVIEQGGLASAGPADTEGTAKVRQIAFVWQRIFAVAAVVLLVLSTALNFYFFNQYRNYYGQYQSLVQQQTDLASHNEALQTRLQDYERTVDMMKNPDMAIIKMPAIPSSPDLTSATTVYWDTNTKDVYLTVNKLPAPAPDQQYQLWAMVDGKPVDAGVFDVEEGSGLVRMKNIPRAQAFAITLEKKGGSPVPSLDKLYVLGKV